MRPVDAQTTRDRGVEVVGTGRLDERGVSGDDGEHPGFDLAEVGADEHVPGAGVDGRAEDRGQVVQAARGGHASGAAVAGTPLAAEAVVGADVLGDPGEAVGGGDPFLGSPPQQRGDDGVDADVVLEDVLAGRGDVDPDGGEHRADGGGIAQVDVFLARDEAEHLRVALGGWPAHRTDDRQQGVPVDGQPVVAEFLAEQRRRGLGGHGAHEAGRDPLGRPTLSLRAGEQGLRPREETVVGDGPLPRNGVGTQIAVGADRRVVVPVVPVVPGAGEVEEVAAMGGGTAGGIETVGRGPGEVAIGVHPPDEKAVGLGDVPHARGAHPAFDEHPSRARGRPPHPARPVGVGVDARRETRGVGEGDDLTDPGADERHPPHRGRTPRLHGGRSDDEPHPLRTRGAIVRRHGRHPSPRRKQRSGLGPRLLAPSADDGVTTWSGLPHSRRHGRSGTWSHGEIDQVTRSKRGVLTIAQSPREKSVTCV